MVAAASSSPTLAAPSSTSPSSPTTVTNEPALSKGIWSQEEHERFLEGMKMFPRGPVRFIAAHVGTRSVRQVQTHTQKYQEKVSRRLRGLRKCKKNVTRPEHRIDDDAIALCSLAKAPTQQATAPTRTMNLQPLLNAVVLETAEAWRAGQQQPTLASRTHVSIKELTGENPFPPEARRVAPYTV